MEALELLVSLYDMGLFPCHWQAKQDVYPAGQILPSWSRDGKLPTSPSTRMPTSRQTSHASSGPLYIRSTDSWSRCHSREKMTTSLFSGLGTSRSKTWLSLEGVLSSLFITCVGVEATEECRGKVRETCSLRSRFSNTLAFEPFMVAWRRTPEDAGTRQMSIAPKCSGDS